MKIKLKIKLLRRAGNGLFTAAGVFRVITFFLLSLGERLHIAAHQKAKRLRMVV